MRPSGVQHNDQGDIQQVLGQREAFSAVATLYLGTITSAEAYDAAESLLQSLVERMETPDDPRYITLFRLLARQIQAWEDQHEPIRELSGHELLAGLMQQHQLTQKDLADLVDQSTLLSVGSGKLTVDNERPR
jgi:antitoxin component HigA of HigAB toxin-antitoxin module